MDITKTVVLNIHFNMIKECERAYIDYKMYIISLSSLNLVNIN